MAKKRVSLGQVYISSEVYKDIELLKEYYGETTCLRVIEQVVSRHLKMIDRLRKIKVVSNSLTSNG